MTSIPEKLAAIKARQEREEWQERLQELARKKLADVAARREEIIEAFIAKYGFEPDRARLVEQRMGNGETHWFMVRATDEQMEAASRICSQL